MIQKNIAKSSTRNGKPKRLSKSAYIVLNVSLSIFSLLSVFSGTYAWFAANRVVSVTGASFQIAAPEGIKFDLYYLDVFSVDDESKDGNWNPSTSCFAGYEKSYPASSAIFTKVNYDEEDHVTNLNDPTNISHLWPARHLTFALTSKDDVSSFSLSEWEEVVSEKAKTSEDDYVSISWAINMYGACYQVNESEVVTSDIKSAYSQYQSASDSLVDRFTCSEKTPAISKTDTIPIVSSISSQEEEKRLVLFFTIEFSNDPDTYYLLDEKTSYYEKDRLGNSNCYINLALSKLIFSLS